MAYQPVITVSGLRSCVTCGVYAINHITYTSGTLCRLYAQFHKLVWLFLAVDRLCPLLCLTSDKLAWKN